MPRSSAGVILLAFRQGRRRRLPCQRPRHCSKTPKDRSGTRGGRFARPQGEGWLPPAEAENAANVALRLPGSAVSPCLPMLASVNRGNNGFEGNAEVLCRRYPPRLPAREASSSALPKAPALLQNSKGPLRPAGAGLQGHRAKDGCRQPRPRTRQTWLCGCRAALFPLVYRC